MGLSLYFSNAAQSLRTLFVSTTFFYIYKKYLKETLKHLVCPPRKLHGNKSKVLCDPVMISLQYYDNLSLF